MLASNTLSLNASEHPVKSVTIFQSSTAEVTRTFSVNLHAGRNVVEISCISSRLDEESPRIHGLGTDARVFDISSNAKHGNALNKDSSKNAEALRRLNSKLKTLEAERDIRQQEDDLLDRATQTLVKDKSIELDEFVDTVIRRKRDATKAVLELNEQIQDLNGEIRLLRQSHKGETAARIVATLLAKKDCAIEFQLTYIVTGVGWQPYYDLHASTADGKPSSGVTLLYCANITQNSGEDWNDTVLTLSTASSQALKSLEIPKIDPLKVAPTQRNSTGLAWGKPESWSAEDRTRERVQNPTTATSFGSSGFVRTATTRPEEDVIILQPPEHPHAMLPPRAPSVRKRSVRTRRRVAIEPGDNSDEAFEADAVTITTKEGTSVDRTTLSLAYRVDDDVTLPSDGIAHKIAVALLEFSAELKYVCVPRKNLSAFIEGSVKNTSEFELLAGPVSVFMDEGFVTKTTLDRIGVDENFNCVLGVDTGLKVSYEQRSQVDHEPARSFSEASKTTTRTVTTKVTNGHAFDIEHLFIRDAIPLGDEDSGIKVKLLKPEGLAQAKEDEDVAMDLGEGVKDAKVRWSKIEGGEGGEKDGMYEWKCGLQAGKAVELVASWAVKAPATIPWEEKVQPKSSA